MIDRRRWVRARVRDDSRGLIAQADGLIFDIDGVLIDVRRSFREAIARTVQFYFRHVCGLRGRKRLITVGETQLFKLSGGFNNDWELTDSAIIFYLVWWERTGATTFEELRTVAPPLTLHTAVLKSLGGGPQATGAWFDAETSDEEARHIRAHFDPDIVRRVFQEIYAGNRYCERLYGFTPTITDAPGLIDAERVLLTPDDVLPITRRIGILTGRTPQETEVALELCGFDTVVPAGAVVADDGILVKPDPKTLDQLATVLGFTVGIFAGDTIDDWRTVRNYAKLKKTPVVLSAMVARDAADADLFWEMEADIVARSPRDVVQAISDVKEER